MAGIAVHPVTGRLYVCNESSHEIGVLEPETLTQEATIASVSTRIRALWARIIDIYT